MKLIHILILFFLIAIPLQGVAQPRMAAQNSSAQSANRLNTAGNNRTNSNKNNSKNDKDDDEDPCIDINDDRKCWTLDPLTGIMHYQVPDTSHIGLAMRQTMIGQSLGLLYTGNLYSPHRIEDYFSRRDEHDLLFVNAYSLFNPRQEDILYRSTKVPYTVIGYMTSGSNRQSNDHLLIDFAGNFNKQIGIGTSLNYVYARGDYVSSATKPLKWTSYAYYNGDRYKANLNYSLIKLANQENGGIQDSSYVLSPDSHDASLTDPKSMPVNLNNTWNDIDGWNLHLTHSYELGRWSEEYENPDDTASVYDKFTSIASIFNSIDIESYTHKFRMDKGGDLTPMRDFFPNRYMNENETLDSLSYNRLSFYGGIRVNEGFSKWSQFGLSAFIGYERQSYTQMVDSTDIDYIERKHTSNNVFVGGQLSRHQSSILTFDVTAKIGVSGDKVGDVDVNGIIQTVIPFGKTDSLIVNASGYFRNQKVAYMKQHFFSNHFRWNEDFNPEQRFCIKGTIAYPRTGTTLRAGYEHISNFHYFSAKDYLPKESSEQLDVFGFEIEQKLHWKAINFNNRFLFQKTTGEEVLSLPAICWQSDLNLRFRIAKTLWTELGCTGTYHTKYYAPFYQPATQQFAAQNMAEYGGFPTFNAYLNCNLKRIKFYVMYSGFGTQSFSNDNFIMRNYPSMPTRIEYGVVIDLQD